MKEQLTKEKEGKLNNFGYNEILVSFALEQVPLIQPHHIILNPIDLRVPQMRWIDHMSRHAGPSKISVSLAFFACIRKHFYHEQ